MCSQILYLKPAGVNKDKMSHDKLTISLLIKAKDCFPYWHEKPAFIKQTIYENVFKADTVKKLVYF